MNHGERNRLTLVRTTSPAETQLPTDESRTAVYGGEQNNIVEGRRGAEQWTVEVGAIVA